MKELGYLKNPIHFTQALFVDHLDKKFLLGCLRKMLTIRIVENAIAKLISDNMVKTPCHLAIGQEAIAVGISANLNIKDKIFGCHRSHGHFLALGSSVASLIAEVLGKETGASKGMGGSMHLVDISKGFYGSVPIVAGTIPIAVGAGWAEKKSGNSQIAVSYFGDGACEEGVFHESMNFASLHKLPVLFVCENNLFSSHLDLSLRQPKDALSRFAISHDIEYRLVDGNNVVEVMSASLELISRCRNGLGPGFIEAVTYRWCGHVGPKEDIDVGVMRKKEDIKAWKKRDPIHRLFKGMENAGIITEKEYEFLKKEIEEDVENIVNLVKNDPYPKVEQLNRLVFCE